MLLPCDACWTAGSVVSHLNDSVRTISQHRHLTCGWHLVVVMACALCHAWTFCSVSDVLAAS